MFSDIATVRSALKERLTGHVPDTWDINQFIRTPPTEFRSPIIIFEFTRFESTAAGQALGPGQVGAGVDIVLCSPMSADDAGEDNADQIAFALVQVIDAQSDIFWDYAEKQRLESTGQWVWRIHTTVLTQSKETP